jgi:hypothetical protein
MSALARFSPLWHGPSDLISHRTTVFIFQTTKALIEGPDDESDANPSGGANHREFACFHATAFGDLEFAGSVARSLSRTATSWRKYSL